MIRYRVIPIFRGLAVTVLPLVLTDLSFTALRLGMVRLFSLSINEAAPLLDLRFRRSIYIIDGILWKAPGE